MQLLHVLAGSILGCGLALDNGLGQSPPLGWNSWNHFGCKVNETVVRRTVDALVSRGFRSAGYTYVNLDDCWMSKKRDEHGNLQADPALFPSGMKALGDYIHAQGFKFGIYLSAGEFTCSKPRKSGEVGWGSHDFEQKDAAFIASIGADYLKYDGVCGVPQPPSGVDTMSWEKANVARMGIALNATGRPIYFMYGAPYTWRGQDVEWVVEPNASAGGLNGYRSSFDMDDSWGLVEEQIAGAWGLYHWARARLTKPGSWADFDDLEIGNGKFNETSGHGLTTTQSRTYFSWWAIANAPLLMGADVESMDPELVEIQSNQEVLEINQDFAGQVGMPVTSPLTSFGEVWAKPLSNGSAAAFIRGQSTPVQNVTVFFQDLGFTPNTRAWVRDASRRKYLGVFTGSFMATLAQYDSMLLVVKPQGQTQAGSTLLV